MTSLTVAKLAERPWAALTDAEKTECEQWVKAASGQDLHVLLRYVQRRGKRQSTTFAAVEGKPPTEE